MPKKPGKGRGRNNGASQSRRENPEQKHYFGHDDRTVYSDHRTRPRVSFKMSRISKGNRGPRNSQRSELGTAWQLHLENDVDMSNDVNNRRNNFRGPGRSGSRGARGRRNSPVPARGAGGQRQFQRRLNPAPGNWYKVIIPQASRYTKEFILERLITHIAPTTLIPIMYKLDGNDASFYVDELKIANKLHASDGLITTDDGFEIRIKVRPGFPNVEINQEFKNCVKVAMAKRYVSTTNALDLSEFHRDPDLCHAVFCGLFRPVVMLTVLEIVGEHTPTLGALNLDGNKLQNIDRLCQELVKKLPNLTILYLGNNRIREFREMDALKQLKLIELRLVDNPLLDKYKQRPEDFVSDVRKRFPKLLKLDGVDLPPPIVFDGAGDEDGLKLPPTLRAFSVNDDARQIAATFLHQYFLIFDSESRQPLLDAYDEHASFSLTIAFTHDNLNRFNKYLPHNRNLFRVNDRERRQKLLKQGRLPVVAFLSEIPKTKHYLNSFSMDLNLVTEAMMVLTVTGLFQELDSDKKLLRYFSKTLIIVPKGTGYCIHNEQLHIAEPTSAQKKQIELESSVPVTDPAKMAQPSAPTEQERQVQMAVALSQQSGMNLEWSQKCLNEVQWNFEAALTAFRSFHELGQVPPEAFKN